jgi:cytochrome c-type biogenesis protein CcmF
MVPAGLALLALMGVGPLLAWRRSSTESLQRQFLIPLCSGFVGTLVALILEVVRVRAQDSAVTDISHQTLGEAMGDHVWGLICFGLCAFCLATITQEYARGLSVANKRGGKGILDAAVRLFMRARRRYGGYIIHLGVVLMFFGWAGNAYKMERKVTMVPGDTVEIREYEIRHAALRASEDWQKEMITAELEVMRDGKVLTTLEPARWWYFQAPDQPTTEVARYMAVGEDVYVSMQSVDMESGRTHLRLFINPLVNWIWAGTVLMLLGALLCMGTRRKEGHGDVG